MSEGNPSGLFGSLKRLGDLALGTVQNRLKLFATELEVEKWRFVQALLLTAAAIAFGTIALAMVTLTVVVLFWENGRVPALCVLSAIFLVATGLVFRSLRQFAHGPPGFTGTLGELEKDRACLQPHD